MIIDESMISEDCPLLAKDKCLAKTFLKNKGCNIHTHLILTYKVFKILQKLWRDYVKGNIFSKEGELLAAVHDIGKMTPAFQQKIYKALNLPVPWKTSYISEGHAVDSMKILYNFFKTKYSEEISKNLAEIAGAHHGIFYNIYYGDINGSEIGGNNWLKQCNEELIDIINELNLLDITISDDIRKNYYKKLVLGSIILSDWISSSIPISYDDNYSDKELDNLAYNAINNAGLLPQIINTGLNFSNIFGFSPNSLQNVMLSNVANKGGIYIIESNMGSGKTEAALGLAYSLLEQHKADGIYFALPTQLTSEKIYERLNNFLDKILENNDKSMLIHGNSFLHWTLKSNNSDENNKDIKYDSWFQNKKRALLASFSVGTIDQALLSVINVKHNALRTFALAGKVIIIDEIHSYDTYTSNLIKTLIDELRNCECTIILLSATLTNKACCDFAQINESKLTDMSYPRVIINDNNNLKIIPVENEQTSTVKLCHSKNEDDVLNKAIEHAKNGEQVLWIENTVANVQRIYNQLKNKKLVNNVSTIKLGIIHSNFPRMIRNEKESNWVDVLGKNGGNERYKCGRILVASQVLEQSVDVDADFLITRIAPSDYIFQRLGRLWRHNRTNRPQTAERQAIILYDDNIFNPKKLNKNPTATLPYNAYVLYRSAEILFNLNEVELPNAIRPILEETYKDRNEIGDLYQLKNKMKEEKSKLESYSNSAMATVGNGTFDDDLASTRFSEEPTVQILLLKNKPINDKILYPICGEPIKLCSKSDSKEAHLNVTKELLNRMITIRESIAPTINDFPIENIKFLKDYLYIGNNNFQTVRIAYVSDNEKLLNINGNEICKNNKPLSYNNFTGYKH